MHYCFIDESGDLGFGRNSSDWFFLVALVTTNKRDLEKVVKKVWKVVIEKNNKTNELHATKEKDSTRRRLLLLISKLENCGIIILLVKKEKLLHHQVSAHEFYCETLAYLISEIVQKGTFLDLEIVLDKKETSKTLNQKLLNLLRSNLSNTVTIILENSHHEKGLQAVDFIAWAIFQKYQRKNDTFYNLIKKQILKEIFYK